MKKTILYLSVTLGFTLFFSACTHKYGVPDAPVINLLTPTPTATPKVTAQATASTTFCVQNMLCVKGDHWDPSVCGCVPDTTTSPSPSTTPMVTAQTTPTTTFCVQNMLCVKGDHWDPSVCGCVPDATGTTSPTATPFPTTIAATLGNCGVAGASPEQSVNLLAGSLYGALKSNTGNIFFSPFSVLTAMSMAQEGAKGDTACQMQTVLDLDPSAVTRLPAFQTFLNTLNAPSQPYTLMTSDNLWVQQGFSLLPSYVNDMTTYYESGVNNVDFINDTAGAVNTIDGAVSQQTGGYIPKLLSPSDVSPLTRLVLTNAVYFKGDWEAQFETASTTAQDFHLDNGTAEAVSMMHQDLSAPIGDFNGVARVLALPYKGLGASMFIFLPPVGGTAALETAMTGANLRSWLDSNRATLAAPGGFSTVLALPKFTFSTQCALGGTFPALGMTLAFQPPAPPNMGADLSGIDGMRDLYIQKVIHQAYVGVDEKGTTAAAATGVVIGVSNSIGMAPQAFTVDHPFIFLIVDNGTGTILFMGRVSDPTAGS